MKTIAIAILLIFAIILSTLVAFFISRQAYQCDWNPIDYVDVWVKTSADIEYEMYLPIPIDAPDQTWYLVDFLNVTEGNPTWSVVITSYGIALRIEGKGNVSLRAAATTSKYSYAEFSLANKTGMGPAHLYSEYLVFANSSESESVLSFYVGAGTSVPEGNPKFTVIQASKGTLKAGWQEVVGITSVEYC